jgi:hypothetical protein
MKCCRIAHPSVLQVVENDEVSVVVFVVVVFLRNIVGAIHVAIFLRPLCRIEFRHRTQILDSGFFNSAAFLVLQDFPATPAFFNCARNGSINRNGISLDVHDDSIPFHVEGTPAARYPDRPRPRRT